MKVGQCPKCRQRGRLTRHHILPKRWYGHSKGVVWLCRECHNALEVIIHAAERGVGMLQKKWYYRFVDEFLGEEHG